MEDENVTIRFVLLRTLGTLKLEGTDFSRATPLLLLAYLALEGQQTRRHVAELFWPKHKSTLSNLSMALSHLRKVDPALVESDNTFVSTSIECDAKLFLDSIVQDTDLELYGGAFLEEVYPESHEFEEWLLQTRETLASFAQESFLKEAERLALEGHLNAAATHAEGGYKLRGAPALDNSRLQRFYTLFASLDHPYALKIKEEAEELGPSLKR